MERVGSPGVLIESGAFEAWTCGESIDIDEYIHFCKINRALSRRVVNLEAIPGRAGAMKYSWEEIEESAKVSYANNQRMKEEGLQSIPVFRQGERFHWLEQMLRDDETYIGLRSSRFNRFDEKKRWLDMIFNILTNKDGRPLVKVHGFGASCFYLVGEYPWRSVDDCGSLPPLYDIRHRRSGRLSGPDHLPADTFKSLEPWAIIRYQLKPYWEPTRANRG